LPFSFGTSLALHAVLAGLAAIGLRGRQEDTQPDGGDIVPLTLIAAPAEETVTETERVPAIVAPPTPIVSASAPERRPAVEERVVEKVVPVAEPATVVPLDVPFVAAATPQVQKQPAPAATPAALTPVGGARGDNSSPEPGEDRTTKQAFAGVRAKPAYKRNPKPIYPQSARQLGQEGTVILTVRVTASGRAAQVRVKRSSGFGALDEAAKKAVRNWEFEPARVNSAGVESDVDVPIRFTLIE
jgi:protein TonB